MGCGGAAGAPRKQGVQMQQGKEEGAGGGWFRKAHKAGAQGLRD